MGAAEVEGFLTWSAAERKVAVSTHKQALSALIFLYRHVLGVDLPWLADFERPKTPVRLPTVLSREEINRVLSAMEGPLGDLARLIYGTGMRLMEALRLRVKDVDFERRSIILREGNKDRIVMLPDRCSGALREQRSVERRSLALGQFAVVVTAAKIVLGDRREHLAGCGHGGLC